MRKLENLLKRNYYKLKDPECKEYILEYMDNHNSLLGERIFFIKQFTKVANHLIALEPDCFDVASLKKLYLYNMDGINLIQKGNYKRVDKDNLLSLESHLNSYAGDVAEVLHEETNSLSWAVKKYKHYKESANLTVKSDPKYSFYARGISGYEADHIYNLTGDLFWLQKCYDDCKLSAESGVEINPRHSTNLAIKAGRAANTYHLKTKDLSWLENGFDCFVLSGELSRNSYPKLFARSCGFKGDAAKIFFKKTRVDNWAKIALESYQDFLNYFGENPNPNILYLVERIKYDVSDLEKKLLV